MRAVIQFDARGNGRALWTEALPLSALGKLSVKRASSVEFNPTIQKWEVCLTGEKHPSFRHGSRAKCIQWEIRELNSRLLAE